MGMTKTLLESLGKLGLSKSYNYWSRKTALIVLKKFFYENLTRKVVKLPLVCLLFF